MNEKIKLKSGAMLEMTMLDFQSAMVLFAVISEELLKVNVDLGSVDLSKLADSELDNNILNTLKNIILTLIVSEKLRDSLTSALGRCTYNNQKVTTELFENVNVRGDYFNICWEVLRFNLTPFLPKIDLPLLKK